MEIKTILLAEDNPNDVELTLEALSFHNLANEVEVVTDGEEALDYLYRKGKYNNRQTGNPAVVFLDIKMPKIDGLQVLNKIKSDENLRTIPVVIITSSNEEKDLVNSYNLGVNAYIRKPIDFERFVESVRQIGYFWAVLNEPPAGSVKKKLR